MCLDLNPSDYPAVALPPNEAPLANMERNVSGSSVGQYVLGT